MSVKMPVMTDSQIASWHALMGLHESLPGRWTIVGGQIVHLHCAELEEVRDDITALNQTLADVVWLAGWTGLLRGRWRCSRSPLPWC